MILYSVATTYHLLEAIVYKINYKKEESAVLLISQWLKKKYEWYGELKAFFDDVIVFNANYAYSDGIAAQLREYFESLMKEHGYRIEDFDEIHVYGAEHAFGAYLFTAGISNYFWEEGAGALSKKDAMLEVFEKTHGAEKARFQYENHLGDGEADFVRGRFYDRKYQLCELTGENLIHFDVSDELAVMDETERNRLVGLFYGDGKIEADAACALVLTEHLAHISITTWEEQVYLYKYLADYFIGERRLLFKPHPDDLMYYEYEFPGSRVIRKRFPAELLPYIFTSKPDMVITASSTSIYGLRDQFQRCVEFNFDFSHHKEFYELNRFYIALSMIWHSVPEHKLVLYGANACIVENFAKAVCEGEKKEYADRGTRFDAWENEGISEPAVFLFDKIENPDDASADVCRFLERMPEDSLAVFLNTDGRFCFYNYEYRHLWGCLYPVEITIRADAGKDAAVTFAGPPLLEMQTETIYVYSKKGYPKMYELKRELPNVGATVESEGFEGDKLKIRILEGMLEATEKRLLYYIGQDRDKVKEEKAK